MDLLRVAFAQLQTFTVAESCIWPVGLCGMGFAESEVAQSLSAYSNSPSPNLLNFRTTDDDEDATLMVDNMDIAAMVGLCHG